ncbi:hypothetical protein GCM10028805_52330 [Spirosoma harenae]
MRLRLFSYRKPRPVSPSSILAPSDELLRQLEPLQLDLLLFSRAVTPIDLETCQFVVQLPLACLAVLRRQLEIDIDANTRRWSPIRFKTMDLFRIERLITRHSDSKQPIQEGDWITYTHEERKLIARYVARYRLWAKEADARMQFQAYECLIANLLNHAKRQPLPA